MKVKKRVGILVVFLLLILSFEGCGRDRRDMGQKPSKIAVELDIVYLDQTIVFELPNCPPGSTTKLISYVDKIEPDLVEISPPGILHMGDEITRVVNCGSGPAIYAFGRVSDISPGTFSFFLEVYPTAELREP